MKKTFIYLICVLMGYLSVAQSSYPPLYISGQVTDVQTGAPLAGYIVGAYSITPHPTWYYFENLVTDANGVYSDTIYCDTSFATIYLYTLDCNGGYSYDSVIYTGSTLSHVKNFAICTGSPTIFANYTYTTIPGTLNVQFTNLSSTLGSTPLQHSWSIGSNITSNQANPLITFPAPGYYPVILTVTDGTASTAAYGQILVEGTVGNCSASFTQTTDIWGNATFTSTSINLDPNNFAIIDYGDISNGVYYWYHPSPTTYTYNDSGAYRVCMAYEDSFCVSVFCDTVVTSGYPSVNTCAGVFYNYPLYAQSPVINFAAQTAAINPTVTWDFGDGSTGTGLNPQHLYTAAGIYTVCMTVQNPASGCQQTFCDTVQIGNIFGSTIAAAFSYTQQSTGMVYFTDQTTPPGFYNYYWDFGNGQTSNLGSPSVYYADTGWYHVCVAITDLATPNAPVNIYCDSIHVDSVQTGICQASFTYTVNPDSSITFNNTSVGTNFNSQWYVSNSFYFFDAYTPNPTFQLPAGVYNVTLNTYGTTCNSSYSDTISVGGSFGICNANFSYNIFPSGLVQFFTTGTFNPLVHQYWDFGNGFTSSAQSPSMIYNAAGTYTVTLYVFDLLTGCQSYSQQTITLNSVFPVSGSCQANFSTTQDSTGLITLTDLSTPAGNLDYLWDFGDGTFSTIANNQHMYGVPGNYDICLTILDNASGCISSYCDTINAQGYYYNNICSADYSYFADSLGNFQFFSPPFLDSLHTLYYWTFDNGLTSSLPNPTYNFNDSLTHWVCLETFDVFTGCSAYYCDSVAPFSGYNARFSFQTQNNIVSFINTSTATPNVTYKWNFGDGSTSELKHPVNVYTTSGMQNVCLQIWENGAMKSMHCEEVMIQNTTSNIPDLPVAEVSLPYPNPTQSVIMLDMQLKGNQAIEWEIFDLLGKKYTSGSTTSTDKSYTLEVEVKNLPSGHYFIRLTVDGETLTRKFVKE